MYARVKWRLRSLTAACGSACWLTTLFSASREAAAIDAFKPQDLWNAVREGARDIVIREHMDLRTDVFVPTGNIMQMAAPGLLAPRNTTRSLRVRLDAGVDLKCASVNCGGCL